MMFHRYGTQLMEDAKNRSCEGILKAYLQLAIQAYSQCATNEAIRSETTASVYYFNMTCKYISWWGSVSLVVSNVNIVLHGLTVPLELKLTFLEGFYF